MPNFLGCSMTDLTLTIGEFNQDVGRAELAADAGPVIITDHGEPAYVLMRHEHYQRLLKAAPRIRELLDQPGMDEIDFDPPLLGSGLFRPAELD
jgi:PHD/YefM family antitoxin component YafN of YafNO toxin-antitoxin module